MLRKLKIKFVCINMAIVFVMLIAILGMVIGFTAESLEQNNISIMRNIAGAPFKIEKPDAPPGKMKADFFTVMLYDNGSFDVGGSDFYDLSDTDFITGLLEKVSSSGKSVDVIPEFELRFLKAEKREGTMLVFSDISGETETVQNLVINCAVIGIFSFFLFFGISILLSGWAVKPVEKAWSQQKQFVADASHELKTPLTVIMTNAELLQGEGSPEEKKRFSENILCMSKRMRGLVENLLELARADNGTIKTAFEKINFSDIVYESVLTFEPLCFESGKNFYYKIDKDIILNGSPEHLKRIGPILFDNALKYSFPETDIHVELIKKERFCVLSVKSKGEHIEKEDLRKIFKRFYRVDKSRTNGKSYGLGLSIAESIVSAHRGRIRAESKENENTFRVMLPL